MPIRPPALTRHDDTVGRTGATADAVRTGLRRQEDRLPSGTALLRARSGVLLAFRCVVAIPFLLHPVSSLGLLDGSAPGAASIAIATVEVVAVLLVAVGLFTRPAAFVLSGMMAFAYFAVHVPDGWSWTENGGESAALYCWVFLLLFVFGPGRYSLDRRRLGEAATAV